jgi:hypothetical protein
MFYGVVWNYSSPESGKVSRLMATAEALEETSSPDSAKAEGRLVLAELAPEQKSCMKPLAVVEVTPQMLETLKDCPEIKLPTYEDDEELDFVDVGSTEFWVDQPWWLK